MSKTIIQSIREYFIASDILDKNNRLNNDYLGANPTEYTLDTILTNPIVKQYVDGSAIKQYQFVFGSREYYGPDVLQNIENSGFYEQFAQWVEEHSDIGKLPVLEGDRESVRLEVVTNGYLFDANEENARYQIQLRLIYYEE